VDIDVSVVLGQNITLVYDSLDLQAIDSGELKKLTGVETKSMLMDTPEMIVAVYPPEPTVIEIGDNRFRITLPQNSEDIGRVPLWEIAVKCSRLVSESKSKLVSYGFNYDIGVESERNAHKVTKELFVSNPKMIESALGGYILSFVPRFIFQRDRTRYDLVLEPVDEQRIKVHMNAHFEFEGIALPSQDQLRVSFYEEYQYLASILPRLFEGGE
jgi:hypothetical protein